MLQPLRNLDVIDGRVDGGKRAENFVRAQADLERLGSSANSSSGPSPITALVDLQRELFGDAGARDMFGDDMAALAAASGKIAAATARR